MQCVCFKCSCCSHFDSFLVCSLQLTHICVLILCVDTSELAVATTLKKIGHAFFGLSTDAQDYKQAIC